MAVVFDEVIGTVEPERAAAPDDTSASPERGGGGGDVHEVRRAMERMAVRRARLFAD